MGVNGVLAGDYEGYLIDNKERCAVTVSSRLTRILFRAIN